MRGTGAALAALAMMTATAGVAVADGVTGPTVQQVRIRDLAAARGPAGVAWLDGRTLHTPSGGTLDLPWSAAAAEQGSLRLLGHTSGAWLVKDSDGGSWRVWAVSAGQRTKLFSVGVSEGDIVRMVLSDDHRRVVVSDFDGDATSVVSVHRANGKQVASRTFDGDAAVLDFSGPRVVLGTTDSQLWWINDPGQPDGSVTDLGVDATGASIENNLLLVRDSSTGAVGPTPMDDPGPPSWTAPMKQPRLTPSGRRVVSRPETGSQELEVRALGNGIVLRHFEMRYLSPAGPVWADNHRFAFVGSTTGLGDRERLATCAVKGRCVAHSVVRPRDILSLPPL